MISQDRYGLRDREERSPSLFGFFDSRNGSITLDASLVFPVIMLATFLILFYALYMAQGAMVYYKASIAGERAAFNWSHSSADWMTGAYPEGDYEPLYWRMTDDSMLNGLFGTQATGGSGVSISYPGEQSNGSLALRKLNAVSTSLASGFVGKVEYRNQIIFRSISVTAELPSQSQLEPLRRFRGSAPAGTQASAAIADPVEWIRSFDLIRYYTARMSKAKEGKEKYRSEAASVLSSRG